MKELIAKLLALKAPGKIGVTVGAIGALGLLFFQFVYSDLSDDIGRAEAQRTDLETEREQYAKRKKEYLAYRSELRLLQEEQRELLRALPKKAEIPSFISNVQEQAELSGLEVLHIDIDPESPQDLYVKIPVKMEIRGTYHQVAKFFKNTSELRRIVNVQDLSLTPERNAVAEQLNAHAREVRRGDLPVQGDFARNGGRQMRAREAMIAVALAVMLPVGAGADEGAAGADKKAAGAGAPAAGTGTPTANGTGPSGKAAVPPAVDPAVAAAQRAASLRKKVLRDEDFVENDDVNRDPFHSYLRLFVDKGSVKSRKVPALFEKLGLEELALIAIVSGDSTPYAMFRDPSGLGETVRKGDYISKSSARVTKILSDRVVVELMETNAKGEPHPVERAILVNPDEGAR
jgi:type IV pilus assembly protein PilO